MDSKVPSRFHNISLIIFRKIQLKKFNKAHGDKNLFQVTEIEISAPWSCISLRWKEYEVKILYVNTQNNKYMKQRVHKSSYPVPSLAASKFCLFVVFFFSLFWTVWNRDVVTFFKNSMIFDVLQSIVHENVYATYFQTQLIISDCLKDVPPFEQLTHFSINEHLKAHLFLR